MNLSCDTMWLVTIATYILNMKLACDYKNCIAFLFCDSSIVVIIHTLVLNNYNTACDMQRGKLWCYSLLL